MSDADRTELAACAMRLLAAFPAASNDAELMSAAFAVQLERRLVAPIQVVAGTLTVEGQPVFDDRQGHVWVMIGPYIADISIFRIAYSRFGPAALSRHVDLTFGPNKGLYVDPWHKSHRRGLGYEPRYVLSEEEVTRLMGGAYQLIESGLPKRAQDSLPAI
ncbi:hypothetical protein [Sphingobium sp.]|uniref:hypothetical protein n=1 Tax=Sphingobium sp. TaxID=1912891 RepID=UPI002C5A2A9A|nr:hypothetical protein [Sphingobium sp.]HUD95236.1 hypothetical protein [Sphingobium sp.]